MRYDAAAEKVKDAGGLDFCAKDHRKIIRD
jgi:hypothetical protein